MKEITMTKLIHNAQGSTYRYGYRIKEVCYETHTFRVVDEEHDWLSLEQAQRSAENLMSAFGTTFYGDDGHEYTREVEFYRYNLKVESLCGTKWHNVR